MKKYIFLFILQVFICKNYSKMKFNKKLLGKSLFQLDTKLIIRKINRSLHT